MLHPWHVKVQDSQLEMVAPGAYWSVVGDTISSAYSREVGLGAVEALGRRSIVSGNEVSFECGPHAWRPLRYRCTGEIVQIVDRLLPRSLLAVQRTRGWGLVLPTP